LFLAGNNPQTFVNVVRTRQKYGPSFLLLNSMNMWKQQKKASWALQTKDKFWHFKSGRHLLVVLLVLYSMLPPLSYARTHFRPSSH
jgi:hypothetical protein